MGSGRGCRLSPKLSPALVEASTRADSTGRGVGRRRQGLLSAWFKPALVPLRRGTGHRKPGKAGQPGKGR